MLFRSRRSCPTQRTMQCSSSHQETSHCGRTEPITRNQTRRSHPRTRSTKPQSRRLQPKQLPHQGRRQQRRRRIGHGYSETDITSTPKCRPNVPDLLLCQSTLTCQKTNHQSHHRIPHPLYEHLLPCPALDQTCLDRQPHQQYQQQQQHQRLSPLQISSRSSKEQGYRSELSQLKSRISQPTKLQPCEPPLKSPHPDPQTQRKQHDHQPTTMEISRRETHGSGSYTSTSERRTSPMTKKSQLPYPTFKEVMPQSGETGKRRNSPTGKPQSPMDKTPCPSSRTSLTSSHSSKHVSATPILRERHRGSWQELVWEKRRLNSTSTISDSIKHQVDTTMYDSSNFSDTDSHHGYEHESASSTPLSPRSSNGKKKQSSSTDRNGWTKQSSKTSKLDKDIDSPLVQPPRRLRTDHPPQSTCHPESIIESFVRRHLTMSPLNQDPAPQDPWT